MLNLTLLTFELDLELDAPTNPTHPLTNEKKAEAYIYIPSCLQDGDLIYV